MLSKFGRKVFFIYPPEVLKGDFLESIFKNEYETYLLDSIDKIDNILKVFEDSIVFINIDEGFEKGVWINFIRDFHKSYPHITIGVLTKDDSPRLSETYLMDIGIKGGFIVLKDNTWKSIDKINRVLEANEAKGRRKNVRYDIDESKGEKIFVKLFTAMGTCFSTKVNSISAMGILVEINESFNIESDEIEQVVINLEKRDLRIKVKLLKKVNEESCFLEFVDCDSLDFEYIKSFIFNSLQNSFKKLLNSL